METKLNNEEMACKMAVATQMSKALMNVLNRQYYDHELSLEGRNKLLSCEETLSLEFPSLLKFERIGKFIKEDVKETLVALQTTLQMCHNPDRTEVVFLILNDGYYNEIYLGVRSKDVGIESDEFVKEYLGRFLEANWQGTKVSFCPYESAQGQEELESVEKISKRLEKYRYGISFTGLPASKTLYTNQYPLSLEKFLMGMVGTKFAYLVVAEPIREAQVDELIFACREMKSQIQMLKNISFSETLGEGYAKTEGSTTTETETWGKTTGHSNKGPEQLVVAALGVAGMFFSPLGFVQEVMKSTGGALAASMSLNSLMGMTKTFSSSEQAGGSHAVSHMESITNSENNSRTISVNYVNAHVEAMASYLDFYSQHFEKSKAIGSWNVGAYVLTEHETESLFAATQLKAILSGEGSRYEPIRIHPLKYYWNKGAAEAIKFMMNPNIGVNIKKLSHPFGKLYMGLTTPMTTEELALLINIPRESVAGIPTMPTAHFSMPKKQEEKAVELAKVLSCGRETNINYALPIEGLVKHMLVAGISGSGKSHTCRKLLQEIKKQGIPFLVIEPAKDEYVEWALAYNKGVPKEEQINVFVPGCTHFRGERLENKLRLNPFEVIWLSKHQEPQALSHIDRLKALMTASLPMEEILPVLLEDLIYEIYELPSSNWLTQQPSFKKTLPPTLSAAYLYIDQVIKKKEYEQRVKMNLSAALKTRINSFRRGWKGELFDSKVSCHSTPWHQLFDQPTVINLAYLGDENDKAFTMALILQFLYEYRMAQAEVGEVKLNGESLRHLAIVEEAHRVMPEVSIQQGGAIQTQRKTSQMFSNILSEIRAYGQGIVIAEQIPSRLVADAIKNTSLKWVHRLVSQDDKQMMASCMNLTEEQMNMLSRLSKGQAIVSGEYDDEAIWLKVNS